MIECPSDFRWQYLPRFPTEVLNKVTEYFWSNCPTEEDIASIPNEVPYIGNTSFANMFTETALVLDHPLLKNAVLFNQINNLFKLLSVTIKKIKIT